MIGALLLELCVLAGLLAGGTWLGGWWMVPGVAGLWALVRRSQPVWMAGIASGLAWGILLLTIPWDSLGRLAGRLGGLFHLPGWGMFVLTVGFGAALGWSAARTGREIRPRAAGGGGAG